jgi:protein-tyrosine phosphatase
VTTPMVLTVCLGNICRSPTAEAALREAAADAGFDLVVRSAGTGGWHIASPPDRRMRQAAAEVGLTLDGAAEQVDARMLREADLVLAMDRSNLRDLERLAARADVDTPIHLFRDFDPDPGDGEVPDPYYGGQDGFTEVVTIVRRTAREVVRRLANDELVASTEGDPERDAEGDPEPDTDGGPEPDTDGGPEPDTDGAAGRRA